MQKLKQVIGVSGLVAALLLLGLGVQLASADPANAILSGRNSVSAAYMGEQITVTLTLDAMDANEAFVAWAVRLGYDPAVLNIVAHEHLQGCWSAGGSLPPSWVEGTDNVYLGQMNFSGSVTTMPCDLATVTFEVVGYGDTSLAIITLDPDNDTVFTKSDYTTWQPGTVNQEQSLIRRHMWTGAVDTDWDTAGNWTPNDVPGLNYAVEIPGGLSHYPVLQSAVSVYSLTVDAGGSLEVPDGQTLQADMVSNYGDLVLWKDVADGVAADFHIYDSGMSVSYYGVVITSTGAMNATSVTIKGHQDCTSQDEPGDTADRCYDVAPDQAPTSADIRFYYLADELDGQVPAAMNVWHWNSGTLTWTVAGTASPGGSAPDYYVDVAGVTAFSPFVLKSGTITPTHVKLQGVQAVGGWITLSGVALVAAAWILHRKRR